MKKPLYHLLYTNAPGTGGGGYRHISVSFPKGGDPVPIQRWLETLQQVAPGVNEGWAYHSFGIDRTLYSTLAVVNPSFSPEEHGRGRTVLVHALLIPLQERQPVGDFGGALYVKAKSFLDVGQDNLQRDLDWYLRGFGANNDLDIPEPDLRSLRELEPGFLARLFAAASGPVNRVAFPGIESEDLLPERILLASAVLPPPLRLQLSWRVGFPSVTEGFVAFTGAGEAGSLPAGKGAAFCDWVDRALRDLRFELVRQISENWEIRDWESLAEAVRALSEQPAVATFVPLPIEDVQEEEMAKKRTQTGGDRLPAPARSKTAEAYDAEYQSLQKNLQEYVDRRLASLRGGGGPPMVEGPADGIPVPRRNLLKTLRPEIYFLAALLLFVVWLRRAPGPTAGLAGAGPAAEITGSPEPEPTTTPESSPPSVGDPLESWGIFVNENKSVAGAWFRALAEHRELEARQVKPPVAAKFAAWAQQLERDEALASPYPQESVTGLFEFVHARWAKENGKGNSAEDQVTFNPGEVQRNLPALLAELELTDDLGTQAKATDSKVQVAVACAWLERHPQP